MNDNVSKIQEVLNTFEETLKDTWAFKIKTEHDEIFINGGSDGADWKLLSKEQCIHLAKLFNELAESIPDTDKNRIEWLESLKVGDKICYKQYLSSDDIELIVANIENIHMNNINIENSIIIDKKDGNGYNNNQERISIQPYIS